MDNHIWVDLTDMLVWRGHYTGVQRVTYEYASRYEKDGAKFFAYDAIDERFFEVALDDVLASNQENLDEQSSVSSQGVSRRRKIRNVLAKPYRSLNGDTRAFLAPYAHALNHTVRSMLHLVKRTRVGEQRLQRSVYHDYTEAVFRADDTVVLLGAGWNEMRVLEQLVRLKSEIGFSLSQHINDILPIYQPHLFADELPRYFHPYVKKAVESADIITVISKATKRDVEVFCKQQGIIDGPKVSVIRLGDNPQINTMPSKPNAIRADEEFILAVGTFEIRKNYILLYQAIKLAELEGREFPKIVIAGRKGWLTNDLQHVLERDPFVEGHITWLSDVSDAELKWLYQKCMFTVFPSLAEGWGLPIAESLGYGKMCLASGVSSMLEIGDGLVDYFLPYDSRECMEKIIYYTFESRYKASNSKVSKIHKPYTWDDSYKSLIKAVGKK